MSINISVIGRLGADAEVKESAKGKFVTYRMATDVWNRETKAYETVWLRISDFSESGLRVAEYLKKGRQVHVMGEERYTTYTDKDGKTQISRDVNAYSMQFVSGGTSGQTTSQTTETVSLTPTPTPSAPSMPIGMGVMPPMPTTKAVEDDDLPF